MPGQRSLLTTLLVGLLLAAAGAGGGWYFGDRNGRADGFAIGRRYGEVEAGKRPPVPVRDEGIPSDAIQASGGFDGLSDLTDVERGALTALLNQAPTPCPRFSRRGLSLARAIVSPKEAGCGTERAQVPLALAALRTFDDPGEALAVLRVERRLNPLVEGRATRGNPSAPIVLVEYSDFQCPYCVRSHKKIQALVEGRDDVALIYKHLPLRMHPAAVPAALAAEAAAEQGKFWEMHDALFALGRSIGDGVDAKTPVPPVGSVYFEEQAEALGLDLDRFREDVRSERVRGRVDADAAEANRLGVNGTPTFVLGGIKVRPGPDEERFTRQINRALAESRGAFSWDLPAIPPGVDPAAAAGPSAAIPSATAVAPSTP